MPAKQKKPDLTLLSLLYSALHSETGLGIIVITPEPERLRQKLYPLRKEQPEFHSLHFRIANGKLWIVKNASTSKTHNEPEGG